MDTLQIAQQENQTAEQTESQENQENQSISPINLVKQRYIEVNKMTIHRTYIDKKFYSIRLIGGWNYGLNESVSLLRNHLLNEFPDIKFINGYVENTDVVLVINQRSIQ